VGRALEPLEDLGADLLPGERRPAVALVLYEAALGLVNTSELPGFGANRTG